jgi:hypothetical protein
MEDERQTILREYTAAFPYKISIHTVSVNHFVAESKRIGAGNAGRTKCGRNVGSREIRTRLDVLNLANNPCLSCLDGLTDREIETLALMASAASQHETTPAEIGRSV